MDGNQAMNLSKKRLILSSVNSKGSLGYFQKAKTTHRVGNHVENEAEEVKSPLHSQWPLSAGWCGDQALEPGGLRIHLCTEHLQEG